MEYKIEIKDDYIYVSFSKGTTLTVELVQKILQQERNLPEYKTLDDIWDTRGCSAHKGLNSKTVGEIVEYIKKLHAPDIYHKKSALIVDSDISFGLSRMFQTLAEELPYETEIFKEAQEAKNWITS